jgi:GTPase SAR1 family protein
VLLVFDATDPDSFERLDYWMKATERYCAPRLMFFLVATKTGAPDQKVSLVEAEEWAASHSMPFFRTDAMSGEGIQPMFDQIIQEVGTNFAAHLEEWEANKARLKKKSSNSNCIIQ